MNPVRDLVESREHPVAAAESLVRDLDRGRDIEHDVLAAVDDADPAVRRVALYTCGLVPRLHERLDQNLVFRLLEREESPSPSDLSELAEELAELARTNRGLLRDFFLAMQSPDASDRLVAIRACWVDSRLSAIEAIPHLARATRDDDRDVRESAVTGLGQLGAHALKLYLTDALPALVSALDDGERDIRTAAMEAIAEAMQDRLADVGSSAPDTYRTASAYSELVSPQPLDDPAAYVHRLSASDRNRIRIDVTRGVERIVALAGDADVEERAHAIETLGKLQLGADELSKVLSLFSRALNAAHWEVRSAAARALGNKGAAAAPFLKRLEALARDDPKDHVRTAAYFAAEELREAAE